MSGPIYRFPLTGSRESLDDLVGPAPLPHTIEEAARRFGNLRLRRAALWSAIQELQRQPRIAGYPPRIFFSYRWEDQEIQQWCRRLADHLRRRGYEVLLDLEHQAAGTGPGGVNIPSYVARLVDVQVVLRVITAPYVDGLLREWLLVEDQLTKLMTETGCAIIHVLLRDGSEPPDWGRHEMVDLREEPENFARLGELLPPFRGLTLTAEAQRELVELLSDSQKLLAAGKPNAVLRRLADRPDLADAFEVRQTLAHALLRLNRPAEAAEAAVSIESLPGRPTVETTIDVALILEQAGRLRDALRVINRVIELPTSLQPRIRRVVGSLLQDLGAPDAALQHLYFALTLPETARDPKLGADLHNLVGHVRLFSLGDAAGALPHFAAGLALEPDNQHLITNYLVNLLKLGRIADARQLAARWHGRNDLIPPLSRVLAACGEV